MDLMLGIGALGFGLYTGYLRATNPEKLGKLEAMKESMGPGAGNAVHLVAYTLVPLAVGVIFLIRGLAAR